MIRLRTLVKRRYALLPLAKLTEDHASVVRKNALEPELGTDAVISPS